MQAASHYLIQLVFGLGRIFRLERSAIFMTEFRARLELGAINFHLKPCMFTWVKICSPFEIIILARYLKVSSYHLTSTEFQITMISIKWLVDYTIYTNFIESSHLAFSYVEYWAENIKTCLLPCGRWCDIPIPCSPPPNPAVPLHV